MTKLKNEKISKKDIQILGQGSYGCVVRPSINCKTQKPEDRKYISKIQVDDELINKELEIGQLIQKISNYFSYFAPLIDVCPLSVNTIKEYELIKSCDIIKNSSKTQFVLTKVEYVGKYTFGDYFHKLLLNKKSKTVTKYVKSLITANLYLLNSIQILNEQVGVLHLDIKENNIMYNADNDIFTIIDFGWSLKTNDIQTNIYEKTSNYPFGSNTNSYNPWTIEIIMLSFIARKIMNTQTNHVDKTLFNNKANIQELKMCCYNYLTSSSMLKMNFFTNADIKTFEQTLYSWVESFNGKTYREIWSEIVNYRKSWDNYSLAVMFIRELYASNLLQEINEELPQMKFLHSYITLLKNIIFSNPSKREVPNVTSSSIKQIFKRLNKKDYNNTMSHLTEKLTTPMNIERMKTVRKEFTLEELNMETKMKKKIK
jgi:serine/threonine protein kinase